MREPETDPSPPDDVHPATTTQAATITVRHIGAGLRRSDLNPHSDPKPRSDLNPRSAPKPRSDPNPHRDPKPRSDHRRGNVDSGNVDSSSVDSGNADSGSVDSRGVDLRASTNRMNAGMTESTGHRESK